MFSRLLGRSTVIFASLVRVWAAGDTPLFRTFFSEQFQNSFHTSAQLFIRTHKIKLIKKKL